MIFRLQQLQQEAHVFFFKKCKGDVKRIATIRIWKHGDFKRIAPHYGNIFYSGTPETLGKFTFPLKILSRYVAYGTCVCVCVCVDAHAKSPYESRLLKDCSIRWGGLKPASSSSPKVPRKVPQTVQPTRGASWLSA